MVMTGTVMVQHQFVGTSHKYRVLLKMVSLALGSLKTEYYFCRDISQHCTSCMFGNTDNICMISCSSFCHMGEYSWIVCTVQYMYCIVCKDKTEEQVHSYKFKTHVGGGAHDP